jgi:7-cyano-7-deazaguanine synthase
MKRRAVVLLSGGLDSAVTLYYAKNEGYDCHCLNFDYGQRHGAETESARSIARLAGARLRTLMLDLDWKGSSLLDPAATLPRRRSPEEIRRGGTPSTYVPGRNTIFLSIAASFAEAIGAGDIFIGAHSEDSSGYPDCGAGYLELFDAVIRAGTKAGIEGRLRVRSPLIALGKAQIIGLGRRLGVPFEMTVSCYAGGGAPCGECDSCVLRAKGFKEAGVEDPLARSGRGSGLAPCAK